MCYSFCVGQVVTGIYVFVYDFFDGVSICGIFLNKIHIWHLFISAILVLVVLKGISL